MSIKVVKLVSNLFIWQYEKSAQARMKRDKHKILINNIFLVKSGNPFRKHTRSQFFLDCSKHTIKLIWGS